MWWGRSMLSLSETEWRAHGQEEAVRFVWLQRLQPSYFLYHTVVVFPAVCLFLQLSAHTHFRKDLKQMTLFLTSVFASTLSKPKRLRRLAPAVGRLWEETLPVLTHPSLSSPNLDKLTSEMRWPAGDSAGHLFCREISWVWEIKVGNYYTVDGRWSRIFMSSFEW